MKNGYVKRKLEDTILKYLKTPEIIAVVGPRQSGKTTMLRRLYESLKRAVFLSFEDKKILDLFEKETDDFISLYVKNNDYVFIDEFQYAKTGGKILKYIYDLAPKAKIIISGSSAIDLTVRALKHLVGRIFIFTLYPFDFEEFLSFRDQQYFNLYQKLKINIMQSDLPRNFSLGENVRQTLAEYYQEYAIFGGYPRAVTASANEEKIEVLKNIYNTYFLREVKDMAGLADDYKLANLIKALALQIGNLIEYQELSRLSEFSYPTLKKYLNFLDKTFICQTLRPFHGNKRNEIVKNPKVFFLDCGLRNYIVNDFRKIGERTDAGALLENTAFAQFIKQNINDLRFWRTKQKAEVDFVVTPPARSPRAVEIKKRVNKRDSLAPSLRQFQKAMPQSDAVCLYYEGDAPVADTGSNNYFFPLFLVA